MVGQGFEVGITGVRDLTRRRGSYCGLKAYWAMNNVPYRVTTERPYHTRERLVGPIFLQLTVTLRRPALVDVHEEYKKAPSSPCSPHVQVHTISSRVATCLYVRLRTFLSCRASALQFTQPPTLLDESSIHTCNASIETNTNIREKYKVRTICVNSGRHFLNVFVILRRHAVQTPGSEATSAKRRKNYPRAAAAAGEASRM